jgi:hypothetical protein
VLYPASSAAIVTARTETRPSLTLLLTRDGVALDMLTALLTIDVRAVLLVAEEKLP